MPAARPDRGKGGLARLIAAVIVIALAAYFWWSSHAIPSSAAPRSVASAAPLIPPAIPGVPDRGPDLTPEPPPDAPSELAAQLHRPGGDIHSDLRTVEEIFRQYRSSTHRLNPVGENAEITAVLTGRNPLHFAFIPAQDPAINANGELCDRWGSAYFFHALSGTQMEIRSAGPDRKLWTADDEVLTPGLKQPPL
jgi:hypothetical protein